MRGLFYGKLFLRAETAPMGLDNPHMGTMLPRYLDCRIAATRIDNENLGAEIQRLQAGGQALRLVVHDEHGRQGGRLELG